MDMAGERNQSGYIPFTSLIFWGQEYGLSKSTVYFYWDIIKISDGKVKEWQSQRTS